jgi:hypothetical protein
MYMYFQRSHNRWTQLNCLIYGIVRLKRDGTRAETRFRLSPKRTSPFKSARGGGGIEFSRLLAAEVCASAVLMLDTPCSEVLWEYWLPTPFASFPFTSPPVRHRVPSGFKRTLQTVAVKIHAAPKRGEENTWEKLDIDEMITLNPHNPPNAWLSCWWTLVLCYESLYKLKWTIVLFSHSRQYNIWKLLSSQIAH